jgi:hypothetical protein
MIAIEDLVVRIDGDPRLRPYEALVERVDLELQSKVADFCRQ